MPIDLTPPPGPPWRIRRSVTRFANPWIEVREIDCLAPTGVEAVYGLVHFRNLAVGVLPIDAEGMTWLVGQHRFPTGAYSWEIPEGGGDPERPPLEAAKAELAEEVGLQADHWMEIMGEAHLSNSVSDERGFGFLATGLSPVSHAEQDDVEALTVRRIEVAELLRLVRDGAITDAFAQLIVLRARLLALEGRIGGVAGEALRAPL